MFKKLRGKGILLFLFISIFMFSICPQTFAKDNKNRIWGKDRIKTSVEVSKSGWQNGAESVVIAQGYDYADALCGAPLAKKYNAPILLTEKSKLRDETLNEVKRLKAKNVIILGGNGVISQKAEEQLKSINVKNVERIYGSTRYETALKVANKIGKTDSVFITYGKGYADSLSVASIAAKRGAPILFTEGNNITPSVKNYIVKNNISNVYVIGGKGIISDNVVSMFPNAQRVCGKDRYETNKAVMEKFIDEIRFGNVYVVQGAGPKGNEFADALSISPLAAITSSPVVLTYKNIDKTLENFLKEQITSRTNIVAIGGEKVVSSDILEKLCLNLEVIEVSKNNEVFGDEKSVKDINADLTVKGNNVTLRNLKIKGVLTLDPGEKGTVNVQNVTCKLIEVKSRDENSIHFSNVEANQLLVNSISDVRLELKENSCIKNTEVKSSAILENVNGSFGNVLISQESSKNKKDIELRGKFEKKILVTTTANINCRDKVEKIEVNTLNKNNDVTIKGAVDTVEIANASKVTLEGQFKNVNINGEAKIKITSNSKVEKIDASGNSQIDIEKGAEVKKVQKTKEVKIIGEVKEIVEKKDEQGGNNQSSGSSSTKPISKDCFKLLICKNGSIDLEKEIKIEDGKNAMEYLKSCATVQESDGFIKAINSLKNKPLKSLSTEQRQKGILGQDWFIYLNGSKTSKGANGVYLKSGDTLKVDYREWDWKDLMDPGYNDAMPIKIIEIPSTAKAGNNFTIKVECVYYPVYDAVVKVDGTEVGRTDLNGYVTVTINNAGKHTVSVEKFSGKDEKTIDIDGNTGDGDTGESENPKPIFEKKDTNYYIQIMKFDNNKLEINVNDIKTMSAENSQIITIILFNSNGELQYIGQATLKECKCKFNTQLSKGKYNGYYKATNGEKVNIEFTID